MEKRFEKDAGAGEGDIIISLDILDHTIEFVEGAWSTATSENSSAIQDNKPKNQEIIMLTAKYDILLDLLTELTLNNRVGVVRS